MSASTPAASSASPSSLVTAGSSRSSKKNPKSSSSSSSSSASSLSTSSNSRKKNPLGSSIIFTTQLHTLSYLDNQKKLGDLLAKTPKPNPNSRDIHGKTPLHAAASVGNAICINMLLQAGADPQLTELVSKNQRLSLDKKYSARLAEANKKHELKAKKANKPFTEIQPPPAYEPIGWTPLAAAAGSGRSSAVTYLIQNLRKKRFQEIQSLISAHSANESITPIDASSSSSSKHQSTPTQSKNVKSSNVSKWPTGINSSQTIALWLLHLYQDSGLFMLDKKGNSLLHIAATSGKPDCFNIVWKAFTQWICDDIHMLGSLTCPLPTEHININTLVSVGTALEDPKDPDQTPEVCHIPIENWLETWLSVDQNMLDSNQSSKYKYPFVEYLIYLFANLENYIGQSILHSSILSKKNPQIIEFLIANAPINLLHRDKRGFTPFHIICSSRPMLIPKFLSFAKNHPLLCHSPYSHISEPQDSSDSDDSDDSDDDDETKLAPLNTSILLTEAEAILRDRADLAVLVAKNQDGGSGFHLAVSSGDLKTVKQLHAYYAQGIQDLLDKEAASIPTTLESTGSPPPAGASTVQNTKSKRVSPQNQKSYSTVLVRDKTLQGFTPLHIASHTGNLPICKFLIENNANVLATNVDGYSSFDLSRIKSRHSISELLAGEIRKNPQSTLFTRVKTHFINIHHEFFDLLVVISFFCTIYFAAKLMTPFFMQAVQKALDHQ